MANSVYARRYAQAVFEIALEKNEMDRWQADLQRIVGVLGDTDFLAALDSPRIKTADKSRFLKERLSDINPLALNLVMLLVARAGAGLIIQVADEYRRLLDKYRGMETAEITTAVPLDDKEQEALAARLGAVLDAKVALEARVDPEILGGIIARVDGKLLDGSTRSKLAALKRNLEGKG
ncbi:MAG: ATP synthase F1 subunit delta [Dehalococcoidales bacterium]|jgi:F-type H+-transporting ATPase subunit delta